MMFIKGKATGGGIRWVRRVFFPSLTTPLNNTLVGQELQKGARLGCRRDLEMPDFYAL